MKAKTLRTLQSALEARGIDLVEVRTRKRGKHVKMIVAGAGRKAMIVGPASPSCRRATQNLVRDARHALDMVT